MKINKFFFFGNKNRSVKYIEDINFFEVKTKYISSSAVKKISICHTSKHIYKSVVLPKALYGCELWYAIQPKYVELLEKSHRFCVKFMQSLQRRTSTDVALSLLNIDSIEVEIDYRKLIFFGQLCN